MRTLRGSREEIGVEGLATEDRPGVLGTLPGLDEARDDDFRIDQGGPGAIFWTIARRRAREAQLDKHGGVQNHTCE